MLTVALYVKLNAAPTGQRKTSGAVSKCTAASSDPHPDMILMNGRIADNDNEVARYVPYTAIRADSQTVGTTF